MRSSEPLFNEEDIERIRNKAKEKAIKATAMGLHGLAAMFIRDANDMVRSSEEKLFGKRSSNRC